MEDVIFEVGDWVAVDEHDFLNVQTAYMVMGVLGDRITVSVDGSDGYNGPIAQFRKATIEEMSQTQS